MGYFNYTIKNQVCPYKFLYIQTILIKDVFIHNKLLKNQKLNIYFL